MPQLIVASFVICRMKFNLLPTTPQIAEVLRLALDTHFPEESGVQLIAEPGRFFVASAFTLAVSVIASRRVFDDESGEEKFMYYMNDGVYGSFNCILYDHAQVEATLPDVCGS